jgi:trehalose/maltose hydrolase-like predicted phosphorylase
MFLEICRFFASLCAWNTETGRYEITGVMGPDEYHEKYPSAEEGGLKDNAYTNIMLAWALGVLPRIAEAIGDQAMGELLDRLQVTEAEWARWTDIRHKLHIPLSEGGVLEQFEGFFDLKELDWEAYREEYSNISRMDRILKAEGKSPDAYQVTKQADALMPFYNLNPDRVMELLADAGYEFDQADLQSTYEYYIQRTSHGSTLSRLVYAHIAHLIGEPKASLALYREALRSDYDDIQGKTTAEGTHIGVMAGSVHLAMKTFAHLSLLGNHPCLAPDLPSHWRRLRFQVGFRGGRFSVDISPGALQIWRLPDEAGDLTVTIRGQTAVIAEGESYQYDLEDGDD